MSPLLYKVRGGFRVGATSMSAGLQCGEIRSVPWGWRSNADYRLQVLNASGSDAPKKGSHDESESESQ